jgi:hypothetical protein
MRRTVAFVIAAWRAATPKHFIYTFVLALTWSGFLATTLPRPIPLGPAMNGMLTMQFNGFAVLLAVLVADHASPPPLRRWWVYVPAVVVGAMAGSALLWLVSQHLVGVRTFYGLPEPFETFVYRHGTHALVVWGMVTSVYVSRKWAVARVAALRAVQLECAEGEKRVLESRLVAMQASVEPQFLRDTLSRVEHLYDVDSRDADRVLRELISYLRAGIPQHRDPRSTLAKEIQLASAYFNIVGTQSTDRLRLSGPAVLVADVARMPPMILLPLISCALKSRVERVRDDETFDTDVLVRNEKLIIAIRHKGAGFAPGEANEMEVRDIRGRLATLYEGRAQLTLRTTMGGSEAVVEIPYEVVVDTRPAARRVESR